MNRLDNYLTNNKLSNSEFSRRITRRLFGAGIKLKPVSPETVRRWRMPVGDEAARRPQGPYMQAVIDETVGTITANDYYDIPAREVAPEAAA